MDSSGDRVVMVVVFCSLLFVWWGCSANRYFVWEPIFDNLPWSASVTSVPSISSNNETDLELNPTGFRCRTDVFLQFES